MSAVNYSKGKRNSYSLFVNKIFCLLKLPYLDGGVRVTISTLRWVAVWLGTQFAVAVRSRIFSTTRIWFLFLE